MSNNIIGKILLYPFSLIYGLVMSTRNLLYEAGVLKSTKFSTPVISVGNLSIGGAGKTPHVEHLIRLLRDYINVGTLSRGYKRKTKGFRIIKASDNALVSGDEPLQYRRKYPDIVVAVSESRALGIPEMLKAHPSLQTIILDDAFQHLSVTPALNILLTQYDKLYVHDHLLPLGRLRERSENSSRANIIIVSKCPRNEEDVDKELILKQLTPAPYQKVYFSFYRYLNPYSFIDTQSRIDLSEYSGLILISAIANTSYLLNYLESKVGEIKTLVYEDHHIFKPKDIEHLSHVFNNFQTDKKCILTTEKDATRLELHYPEIVQKNLPIFVLPLEVDFHFGDQSNFDKEIKDFLLNFKV